MSVDRLPLSLAGSYLQYGIGKMSQETDYIDARTLKSLSQLTPWRTRLGHCNRLGGDRRGDRALRMDTELVRVAGCNARNRRPNACTSSFNP